MSLTCDWHLIIVNWLHQAVSSSLDGFICAVGWRLCALLKRLPKLMHKLLLDADYPRILLMLHRGCGAWAIGGLWGNYIYGLPVISL
jgi:hypothetical protein